MVLHDARTMAGTVWHGMFGRSQLSSALVWEYIKVLPARSGT
jgi:hypothetical protein